MMFHSWGNYVPPQPPKPPEGWQGVPLAEARDAGKFLNLDGVYLDRSTGEAFVSDPYGARATGIKFQVDAWIGSSEGRVMGNPFQWLSGESVQMLVDYLRSLPITSENGIMLDTWNDTSGNVRFGRTVVPMLTASNERGSETYILGLLAKSAVVGSPEHFAAIWADELRAARMAK